MMLANWLRFLGHDDPAADLRGRYRTRLGWMRIVKRAGGLDHLIARLAERAGMVPVTEPRAGDVGVVMSMLGPAGGIFTGERWAVKLNDGLTVVRTNSLVAWGFRS